MEREEGREAFEAVVDEGLAETGQQVVGDRIHASAEHQVWRLEMEVEARRLISVLNLAEKSLTT